MNNIYYLIDRSDPEFWNIEVFDDLVSALSFKDFIDSDKVTVTANKMEVIRLELYCKIHKIIYRVGRE